MGKDVIKMDERRFPTEVSAVKIARAEHKLVVLVYEKAMDDYHFRVLSLEEYKLFRKMKYGVGYATRDMVGWVKIKEDFIHRKV